MVAVLTALLVMCRPAIPTKPPLKNPLIPEEPDLPAALLPAAEPARPAPPLCPPPTTIVMARMAIMASASIEPPVRPTLTPSVAMKLSIFCDTFKKATAHKNQISTLPVTASFPDAATWASTSLSVRAKTGTHSAEMSSAARKRMVNIRLVFFIRFSFHQSDSGLAINAPTMLTNSRRHHAFISSRKICPANIRHQLLKMLDVA